MFPFQNNNPFFPLGVDLSASQSVPFSSQYLPKQEIPTRVPQIYAPESHAAYANLPSLLNKRPSPVELTSAPVKMLHQDPFSFAGDIYTARELPKSMITASKPEVLDPQKLLYRSQQEIYGLPKGLSLNGQQFAGLTNGLGFPGMEISPAEAQAYLGENSSQAFIRQYLESKGMSGREYGAQIPQSSEGMQRYLASLYGLQGGIPANLGGLSLQNLGGIDGLGGFGGLGSLGNLGNMNNAAMTDLLNQLRNQQMLQQLNQSLSMQLIPGLPETLKNDPRNPNWADLMLLNSAATGQPNNLISSLQSFNMGPSPLQQSLSPPTMPNKGTNTFVLQKPEPIRQPEPIAPRKESFNASAKTMQQSQEMNEIKTMTFGGSESKNRKELVPEKPVKHTRVEPEMREIKVNRIEKESERLPPVKQQLEARNKRPEMPQQFQQASAPVLQQQQPQQPVSKTMEMSADRRKTSKTYIQTEQPERFNNAEKLGKKAITPGNERVQKLMNFEETSQPPYPQTQQSLRSRRGEPQGLETSARFGSHRLEKMAVESSEPKKVSLMADPQNEFLKKVRTYEEVEKTQQNHVHEHERIDPISVDVGENKDHTLTGEINLHQHMLAGENFYKTPERVEEEHVAQKIVETRVGSRFQSDIPELALNDEEDELEMSRRRCRLVWDPEYANSKEVIAYLKGLHRVLGTKVINQERALQLLAKKNFNIDEVLNTIKKNERHYANFFGISNCTRELRSRRSIE